MSKFFVLPLAEMAVRLRKAAAEISAAYLARRPAGSGQTTPDQVTEALEQFLAIAQRLDKGERETGPMLTDDVSQLGDYGLSLLTDLILWAEQLELASARQPLDETALAIGDWVMRHNGELRTLEPIVNALAAIANRTGTRPALEELERYMSRVIRAVSNLIRQDLEKGNPSRPWRVLNLNRGIVATRTHNPEIMEQVYEELVRYLPEDAPAFFAEGMQQMDALDYPAHVRQIVTRYYDRFTRRTMH